MLMLSLMLMVTLLLRIIRELSENYQRIVRELFDILVTGMVCPTRSLCQIRYLLPQMPIWRMYAH